MNKAKGLSIIAMTLLIFQLFSPSLDTVAGTQKTQASGSGDSGKIAVQAISHDESSITWSIAINESESENEGITTNVLFGKGILNGEIKSPKDVDIKKNDRGYTLTTSGGTDTYKVELTTKVEGEDGQEQFELTAEADFGEEVYKAIGTAEMPQVEDETPSEGNSDEEKGKNKKSVSKENESKPDKESSEEESKVPDDFEVEEIEPVIDENFKSFIKNKTTRKFGLMSNGASWPAPGSVNLNGKYATPTSTPGEWEIELSVEAKDIDTTKTTDIVLVFDRSGSMQGNRLTKAKGAARQFVNELLTDGSQTRIAIVTFSDSYQTLAGGFQGVSGKQSLLNAINGISASGGTNIQGGLRTANNLIAQTPAQNKVIVLLSDGAPTYSYKANGATSHSWSFGSYNFRLTNFTNTQLGSGSSYNLSAPTCIPIFGCWGGQQYSVNGYDVKTNGSATISEAWQIMNNGINMYSIGLDVGNDNNAMNVLRNSQNKGSYFGTGDDLDPIFEEIAGQIKHAATGAVVTDPLGDMFNLVKDKYGSGAHFTASHGTVTWDDAAETFTWNIGTIKEGEKPTLKYTVTIDWEHPDLKGHVDYPMNKETPLNYTDVDGNSAVKYFDIPEGQIGKGKIKRIGYRVDPAGKPVDSSGNVVSSPDLAEQFYDEYYGDFHDFGSHDVPAKDVADYTVLVGNNPTTITLGPDNPVKTVLFGYVKTSDMIAGDVTVHYQDEGGNPIASTETLTGTIGTSYTTIQKIIPGYEFKEVDPNGAPASGMFTADPQTVTYIYKKLLGSITVNKVDEDGQALAGAEFTLTGPNGFEQTEISRDDGEITFNNLELGTYTLKETKAPNGYRLLQQELIFEVSEDELHFTETVENTKQDWTIPKTGGIGTLGFYGMGLILMAAAIWFVLRRRQA